MNEQRKMGAINPLTGEPIDDIYPLLDAKSKKLLDDGLLDSEMAFSVKTFGTKTDGAIDYSVIEEIDLKGLAVLSNKEADDE